MEISVPYDEMASNKICIIILGNSIVMCKFFYIKRFQCEIISLFVFDFSTEMHNTIEKLNLKMNNKKRLFALMGNSIIYGR